MWCIVDSEQLWDILKYSSYTKSPKTHFVFHFRLYVAHTFAVQYSLSWLFHFSTLNFLFFWYYMLRILFSWSLVFPVNVSDLLILFVQLWSVILYKLSGFYRDDDDWCFMATSVHMVG